MSVATWPTRRVGTATQRKSERMPRMSPRRNPVLAVLLTSVVVSLVAAAPAGAFLKDFQAVSVMTPSNSQPRKSLEFTCPGGKSAIGAGASIPAISNLGISTLFGGGQGRVFDRASETDSEAGPWALTVRAWCATITAPKPNVGEAASYIKRVVIARNQSSSNSNGLKSVQATCPADSPTVIGGGGVIDGATNEVAFDSVQRLQQGTVLRVKAHETDATGASWAVEAHAICADTTSAPRETYADDEATRTVTSTSNSLNKTLTASCPSGTATKFVVGGGAATFTAVPGAPPAPADVVLKQSRPAGEDARATGWTATAVEVDPTAASWELQVTAFCARLDGERLS
jgi:hypothetical protein